MTRSVNPGESGAQPAGWSFGEAALTGLVRFCAVLPQDWAFRFGRTLGWFFGHVIRRRRRHALTSVARCLPELDAAQQRLVVNRMYCELGVGLVEFLRVAGGRRGELRERVRWEGAEHLDRALEGGKGVLVLTAHLGNFELLALAVGDAGYPVAVIAKPFKLKALDRIWARLRQSFGNQILPPHNTYYSCLKVLRGNGILGFILDISRHREAAVFVDFFGRPTATTPGLAILAAHTGAPVLPVFMHREPDGRNVIRIHPALAPPAGRDAEAIREATQRYSHVIEAEIRRYPGQWLWLHRRWKTRPEPEDLAPPSYEKPMDPSS